MKGNIDKMYLRSHVLKLKWVKNCNMQQYIASQYLTARNIAIITYHVCNEIEMIFCWFLLV